MRIKTRTAGRARRAIAPLVFLLSLMACSSDPYVNNPGHDLPGGGVTVLGTQYRPTAIGNWKIETAIDRVTGAPASSAILATRKSYNTDVIANQPALLTLLCFDDYPIVRVQFDFKVGTTRQSLIGYRFDQKPGHETEARITPDHMTVVLESRDEASQFINELATSKSLYLRIRALNGGRSSAEFDVEGASEAIAAALAKCPATPAKPQIPQQPPKRTSAL